MPDPLSLRGIPERPFSILVCWTCGRAKDEHPRSGPRVCKDPKWQVVEVIRAA